MTRKNCEARPIQTKTKIPHRLTAVRNDNQGLLTFPAFRLIRPQLFYYGIREGTIDRLLDGDVALNEPAAFIKFKIFLQTGFIDLAVGITALRDNRFIN